MPKKLFTDDIQPAPTLSRIGWRWVVVILFAGVFIFGWSVGNSPIASTEGHRALVGHQMLQKGEYLITTIYGRIYQTKPPLHPLTIALSEYLFGGPSEFAWRFPSVLGAALMAAFLALMSDRWFGRPAGLVAGFCSLGMVVLWEQNRTADIDAMNTLFSVVAACCLIELMVGQSRRPMGWAILGGLAFAGSLLDKGPAGMPVIGGVMIGALLAAIYPGREAAALADASSPDASAPSGLDHSTAGGDAPVDTTAGPWSWLKRPWFVLVLAIGAVIFWLVMTAIRQEMARRGLTPDVSGLREAQQRMLATDPAKILKSLLVPLTLIAFSMPVSFLAGYAIFSRKGWNAADSRTRGLIRALAFSLLGAAVIGIIAGITNYRYGYVSLPLLCPLAGAAYKVHASYLETLPGQKQGRNLLVILGMVFFGAFIGFSIISWSNPANRASLIVAGMLVCMAISMLFRGQDRAWRVRGVCALMMMLSIPFAFWKNAESRRKSAGSNLALLTEKIPPGTTVTTGRMLLTQPELFWYAKLDVNSYGDTLKYPVPLPDPQWLLLNAEEYTAWEQAFPNRLASITRLVTDRHNSFLVYYDPTLPATTQPMTRPASRPAVGAGSTTQPGLTVILEMAQPATQSTSQPATQPAP